MECRTLFDSLSAFLDGELEAPQRRQVEEHIGGCAGCRQELESLRVSYQILDEAVDPLPLKADPTLWEAVEAEVSPRQALGRRFRPARPWWKWTMWLPVPAVAVLVVFSMIVPSQVEPQPGLRLQFEKFVQDRQTKEPLNVPDLPGDRLEWDRSDNPFNEPEADRGTENPFSAE